MPSNVLVTGGCGFIGSNFINIMKDRYPDLNFINIDKLDYCSNVYNVKPDTSTLVRGDVGNSQLIEHLIKEYSFDTIFHFAAQSHVDNSFDNALSFTKDNTHATHVLIEACRRYIPNVEFIHFSTDEVYGENTCDVPFKEDTDMLKPTNPYSASKAAAEMIVYSYIQSFGMNVKVIRCNNVYGPNQYPEKLIPKFKKLLSENKPCTIHGRSASHISRSFIHVNDVVDAVDIIWRKGKSGEIYNIASDREYTVEEVTQIMIRQIKKTTDYDQWIRYTEERPFNDKRYYICGEKLKSLGWVQKMDHTDFENFMNNF